MSQRRVVELVTADLGDADLDELLGLFGLTGANLRLQLAGWRRAIDLLGEATTENSYEDAAAGN